MKKSDVLMHPIRMKIAFTLMDKSDTGMTTLELIDKLEDISQATLYRHMNIMKKENLISVVKEVKIRGAVEKYYALNEGELNIKSDDWNNVGPDKKIDTFSYYQLLLLNRYQRYLNDFTANDKSTFSLVNLKLDDDNFNEFQSELESLIMKYHTIGQNQDSKERLIALTIIPE